MIYRHLAWVMVSGVLVLPGFSGRAEMGPGQFFLPQRQDVPLSPRTRMGRKNLQYEYDLHPANVFRHLDVVITQEKKFKLKHHIKPFRDDMVFGSDI